MSDCLFVYWGFRARRLLRFVRCPIEFWQTYWKGQQHVNMVEDMLRMHWPGGYIQGRTSQSQPVSLGRYTSHHLNVLRAFVIHTTWLRNIINMNLSPSRKSNICITKIRRIHLTEKRPAILIASYKDGHTCEPAKLVSISARYADQKQSRNRQMAVLDSAQLTQNRSVKWTIIICITSFRQYRQSCNTYLQCKGIQQTIVGRMLSHPFPSRPRSRAAHILKGTRNGVRLWTSRI